MDFLEYVFYFSIAVFVTFIYFIKVNKYVKILNIIVFLLYTIYHLKLRFYPVDYSSLMGVFFQLPTIIILHILFLSTYLLLKRIFK